jgi:hypothetical protein
MAFPPSVFPAGPNPNEPAGTSSLPFWDIPAGGGSIALTPEYIAAMQAATFEAIRKTLNSGVQEYHVGSRGLKRLSLKDLQDLFDYWRNAAGAISPDGITMSAIQTRRGVPCDV